MRWHDKALIGQLDTLELQEHTIRIYSNRLAISRKDGGWLTWEELQTLKQILWGDEIAIEVYPKASDVVNLRHTRHLWRSLEITAAVKSTCVHLEFSCAP